MKAAQRPDAIAVFEVLQANHTSTVTVCRPRTISPAAESVRHCIRSHHTFGITPCPRLLEEKVFVVGDKRRLEFVLVPENVPVVFVGVWHR